MLKHYILDADVVNPAADKRAKYDHSKLVFWPAGARFKIERCEYLNVMSLTFLGKHGAMGGNHPAFDLLVKAASARRESVQDLLPGYCPTLFVEWLEKQGRISGDDVRAWLEDQDA